MAASHGRLNHCDLPEDVMVEILLRLPVKALLQFKCVCKHWYYLIKTPSFIRQHFNHESNIERLLVRHYRPDTEQYAFALFLDETFCGFEEPDHLQMPFAVSSLMGPVDGIFCLISMSGNMGLLNPSTRLLRPFPLACPVVKPELSLYDEVLGFGLNPFSGDYKLVSIQYFWNDATDVAHHPALISVYTSGNNSWRYFEDVDLVNSESCTCRSLCNTYLNGVYYWLIEYNFSDIGVLAFDMSMETFQKIQVPDCIKSKESDLALYGDSIALIACDVDMIDKCIDIWIMEEGWWTKSLKIGPFQNIQWPLGFWRKCELMIETGMSHLTLYTMNTKKIRFLETRRKENGFFIYWVFCYKESLASFQGEGCKCVEWDTSSDPVKDFFKKPLSNNK